ncbi:dihydropteroate synthase [Clostridium novyi B str. ATCC 27606]|uniref:Dihydropteroate synthase n=2 Tax=Clostridium TaxID=1485 RepID=A0AA40IUP5_CLONO|nr:MULTISPECIES: dihydropteroate synthase [Clostridium]KEI14641.1 dihydropteroate synthase [Clostridium novyi B str. NCTC 9691]KEI16629.1 dihydropteroate synthase [Clostridium novyi B str. ATCC 27606]KEI18466.1 dihydropteroate synthase [Clostridium haemolyticum NCTC 9693]KGN04811.1 dihydropteroate synthase [Clostridium haemolyticum NCTC 8350]OOB76726.1 dihydropteroate synthase [Clostridium haemolyticum]
MKIGSKTFELGKQTYIMGILNATPDSFSDGGKFNNIEKAINHAKEMINAGADIIDIGGESTRPNHVPVDEEEEIKRVIPIIKALSQEIDVPISIDTYKGRVAELAIKAGASLINDVWGFKKDDNIARIAAKYDVACCLMHNRTNKNYNNFIEDVLCDLQESIDIALKAGVKKEKIMIDPGFGFAKTPEQNLQIMNELEKLHNLGYPILLGTSRKSTIGSVLDLPVNERVEGTIATTVIGIMKGCDFVRVHDVKENLRAAVMTNAILKFNK